MGYPLDYPLELDSPEHYVFESEDLEDDDIIPIGSTVRSYDFVVGKHILSDDSYFEGVIEKFEPIPTCSPDCNHYIVRTTKVVRNGREEEIVEGRNDYFSTHWNNYGVIPLEMADVMEAETYTPPAAAVTAAKKGLSQRKKWGRGGLSPAEAKSQGIDSGVTRARKISSGKVSRHDVRRMSAFNRHRKNNKPSKKMPDGGPTAGTIAWNLWGGTSGVNWAKKKSATMNAEEWNQRVSLTKDCSCGRKVQPYEFEIKYDEYYKKNYVRAKYRCDCGGGKCRGRIRVGSHGNSRPCTRTAEYRGYCNECSTCERCDISLKQDYEEMGRDEGHKHGFCHQCYDDTARYGAETFGAESIKDNYELAGYLIADGTNTKIAISKETLKNYTKEEVRQFVQSEINNSTEYIKAWYYENFKGLMVRWA